MKKDGIGSLINKTRHYYYMGEWIQSATLYKLLPKKDRLKDLNNKVIQSYIELGDYEKADELTNLLAKRKEKYFTKYCNEKW